ncbi:electron transport complex subunit RsxE [bacterium]
MSKLHDFTRGIVEENPILILVIGLCPLLAVSTSVFNSLGMGIATTFVLLCSNILVSVFKKYIPNQIRIPIFIVIISTFVTITDYVMAAFVPALHKSLGVFVPLIVVNCMILGRAEAFACKKTIVSSILDAFGMGLGFTIVITLIGLIRELSGNGTLFGINLLSRPALIMILPPGGFIATAVIMGAARWWQIKKGVIE